MNIDDYINLAATQGPNMSQSPTSGGSDEYTPPPQGVALLRFVGYVEVGQRREDFKGDVKVKDKVKLIFELHGKNYPVKEVNGVQFPQRITITESISFHEKSNFKKLFLAMRNGDESITHMAQLLGRAFKGRVFHKSWVGNDGKTKTFARLRDDTGYSIGPAVAEDPETGETRVLNVPAALSELRLFLWKFADKKMWDSLYIDGSYGDGRTKNIFQDEIKQALNFTGSAIDRVLNQGGVSEALEATSTAPVQQAAAQRPTSFRPGGFTRQPAAPTRPVVEAFDTTPPQLDDSGFGDDDIPF